MRTSDISIITEKYGALSVEFTYFHNGDYFDFDAIESVTDEQGDNVSFNSLSDDLRMDIEQLIAEFCTFDAIGEECSSLEEELM